MVVSINLLQVVRHNLVHHFKNVLVHVYVRVGPLLLVNLGDMKTDIALPLASVVACLALVRLKLSVHLEVLVQLHPAKEYLVTVNARHLAEVNMHPSHVPLEFRNVAERVSTLITKMGDKSRTVNFIDMGL